MVDDDKLLDQAVDVYLTGLKGLGNFISQPSAEYSLSFEQYMILRTISKQPGIKLMEIAEQRQVTRSAVSRQLRVLMANEYVFSRWVSVFGSDRGKQLLDLLAEFNKQIVQGELDEGKEQRAND